MLNFTMRLLFFFKKLRNIFFEICQVSAFVCLSLPCTVDCYTFLYYLTYIEVKQVFPFKLHTPLIALFSRMTTDCCKVFTAWVAFLASSDAIFTWNLNFMSIQWFLIANIRTNVMHNNYWTFFMALFSRLCSDCWKHFTVWVAVLAFSNAVFTCTDTIPNSANGTR